MIRRHSTSATFVVISGLLMAMASVTLAGEDEAGWNRRRIVQSAQSAVADQRAASSESEGLWEPEVPPVEWQYLVIHHSGTQSGSVESIHAEHSRRVDAWGNPWLGIAYHFVVGNGNGMDDGEIVPTFRWREQLHGAHAGNAVYNARGIGICLIGHFEENKPTERQRESLKLLVRKLGARFRIDRDRLVGHSAIRATLCPGRNLPLDDFRLLLSPPPESDQSSVRWNSNP